MHRRDFLGRAAKGAAVLGWTAASARAVSGASDRIRVGVIGCGGMANGHIDALLKMKETDRVDIAAVCDVFRKRLDAAAAKTGGQVFSDYRRLLELKDLDYVLIATPEHWHRKMILDALDAGKHVYVEKPMTHSIAEAKEVLQKLEGTGLKLQVGVQGMSDESYEVARQFIDQGALGKVVLAQIDYSRNHRGDFWAYNIDPDAQPGVNLDWEAWLGPAPRRPWDPRRCFQWRRYWDYSGGIATDLFVHRVTRIIKAVGLDFPEHVVATGGKWQFTESLAEIPDTFNIMADYPGGPTVLLVSSMANDTPIDHLIRGHLATLEFTNTGFVITRQRQAADHRIDPGPAKLDAEGRIVYTRKGGEDVTLHHRNLLGAIRTGEALKCDAWLGYYGVVVTSMGVESYRRRAYLTWDRGAERVV